MEWLELLIEVDDYAEEIVSEYLWLLGSTGVSIKDRSDFENLPDDGFGTVKGEINESQYSQHPIVLGYFDANSAIDGIIYELESYINQYNQVNKEQPITLYRMQYEQIKSQDWENKWKEYYQPIQMTRYMSIIPVWESYTPESKANICIYLDPGMAFGTGSHPTTELMLIFLEVVMKTNDLVIDVGTGSGILAIAAYKLGAKKVWAYEYDHSVIETARENIRLNTNSTDIDVIENDKLNGVNRQVNVISANILADILEPLIPQAYDNLVPDGALLLSGIYYDKVDEIKQALINHDFRIEQILQRGEWFAIYARKGRENRCKDTL
ncbi:MAG: 50S ribosomal protein L11 methyltransferase [Aerococcus suis]|nr:50S ribosomal protein L11 methyltransferase [Aerococcus suis]